MVTQPRTEQNEHISQLLQPLDTFSRRHTGDDQAAVEHMLDVLGADSLDGLIDETVPKTIRLRRSLDLPAALSESAVLKRMRTIAAKNKVYRSFIGMGYYDTIVPGVIQRNILENPGWYTQYTPYQPEIAQGRLEALLNFQTIVSDLTGLDIANASLLDEGTAAAEAMSLCLASQPRKSTANVFFVSEQCHPQTIDVVQTRAEPLGIEVIVGNHDEYDFSQATFGVLLQYPASNGDVYDYTTFTEQAHQAGASVVVATDLLALTLLRAPGEFGADIAVGSSQRFGVPLGYGGPHAAFMAVSGKLKRLLPGRLVGVSVDSEGKSALRLALQAREQHIRRDRATSNICTAQVLLAIMASMYAVYHGPEGLKQIARRTHLMTKLFAYILTQAGYKLNRAPVFDTVTVSNGPMDQASIRSSALSLKVNLRYNEDGSVGVSFDEATTLDELVTLLGVFGLEMTEAQVIGATNLVDLTMPEALVRTSDYMTHPVFNRYHTEHEMLRYIKRLEGRDLSLTHSMIALGSCTMKLNATTEMIPVTWPEFGNIHPFAPLNQTQGYQQMFTELEEWLAEITGFAGISLQPNAGSQGEYAGLLVIRAYHLANGDDHRTICLIPSSAHGTNPASAVMAGMKVVVVECDNDGNIDLDDLTAKAEQHSDNLAALMVTYPSTHGVFEENIQEIADLIHQHGGQVYMDGANMNAQVGLCRPGDFGMDVCHLNLHKTFCIPHGGGGPGMGPIGVAQHLTPFLPGHAVVGGVGGEQAIGAVSSAPWGSPSILPISYTYIQMMGAEGLTEATKIAILNANYIAARLDPHYPVLYRGKHGRNAHECIIDLRGFHDVTTVDVAKRLIDFGFHAPTMDWPVAGTLMIEPTESESLAELDRFCDAMIAIRAEIEAVESGQVALEESVIHHAPHTAEMVTSNDWQHDYSRESAAYPAGWLREGKFWPVVGRIDNVYGDRNLVCACVPIENYA